jgi:hypothetical protein
VSRPTVGRASTRAGMVGAAATSTALETRRILGGQPPGGPDRWSRQNFRQRPVDLLGGPAAAVGALVTTAGMRAAGLPGGQATALAAALGTSAALGAYDDLAGVTHARGLHGHFAALRRGELTTGIVKMAGLAAAGVLAAPPRSRRTARLLDAALIAGTANLVNLLDLRPGRALKVVAIMGLPMMTGRDTGAIGAAGAVATAAALLPGDLGEQHMLGDCGANALGALIGSVLAVRSGMPARAVALTGVVALTLLSERVSFSAVIAGNPALAAVDAWGRRSA